MPRTITVSTEVFAAIWAQRQDGEENEDAILIRLFNCRGGAVVASSAPTESAPTGIGVRDSRNGVEFPEGFEIFRTYKKREFSAIAQGGVWVRKDDGRQFPPLNQLNASIAVGAENVWNGNWKYRSADGMIRSIGDLRR